MHAADRERVFERYGTLTGHEGGGTGLGLAIARWVADLHGGSIRFTDPEEGADGARVVVTLPLAARSTADLKGSHRCPSRPRPLWRRSTPRHRPRCPRRR